MGLKDAAKRLMERAGVPVVPGYHGEAQELVLLATKAREIGYPVLIKARAGGGGKGMRRVDASRRFRRGAIVGAARGQGCLRRRQGAGRKIRGQAAAYRGAGVRRQFRQCRAPVRARLLGAAAASEGDRGGPCPRDDGGTARSDDRGRRESRQGDPLFGRRHDRVHRRRLARAQARWLLVHGDEHPPAGRASGDGDGDGDRPGGMAAARRGRRKTAEGAGRDPAFGPCLRGTHLCRGPGQGIPAGDRHAASSEISTAATARRSASRPACDQATASRLTTTR